MLERRHGAGHDAASRRDHCFLLESDLLLEQSDVARGRAAAFLTTLVVAQSQFLLLHQLERLNFW